jgi:hypothetical protein
MRQDRHGAGRTGMSQQDRHGAGRVKADGWCVADRTGVAQQQSVVAAAVQGAMPGKQVGAATVLGRRHSRPWPSC